ncbi:tetratricopeptide repeat protein [Pontibacter arcticus]|uniref:hypothetical protein n=1 Tax=Pontibacter arcticus TaxID=2080288 RepID=UPI001EF083EB|nr:hypothetical protein [Pontibacter arcticus]
MKRTILSLWCFALVLMAQAQTKLVFEETKPEAYLLKYNGGGNSQAAVNNIINLLKTNQVVAKGGGRPNRMPEFILRFEQQARIANQGNELQLNVKLTKLETAGDVTFRDFELADALYPDKITYKINLLSGGRVLKTFSESIALAKNEVVLLDVLVPDSAKAQNYTLQIVEKELVYSNSARVQARLDLIKEYYAAHATVQTLFKEGQRIQPGDVDILRAQDRELRALEEKAESIKVAPLREKLNLQKHDPKQMLANLRQVNELLEEKRKAINYALATLDQQFYNKGYALLGRGNHTLAHTYFVKAVEVNSAFAPAHLQLARIDFTAGSVREAAGRTRDILTKMRTDRQTEEMAMGLAHDIYTLFISEGNSLNSRGDYRTALIAYNDARAFCSTIGGLRCNLPAINDGEARAATGAYRNMLREGKQLLAKNDLAGAERVVADAFQFQEQYAIILQDERGADELQNQVKFQFYLQYIDGGKRSLSQQNNTEALEQFEEALELEQQYTFKPIPELQQLAKKAAKPVILLKLTEGYQLAQGNKLADARNASAEATALQNRYALQQDKDVQIQNALLRERIFTQECLNAQALYDKHFQNGKALAQQKQFIAADQAYRAAIKIAEANTVCTIASFTATDARAAIAPAVAYQQKLEDINRQVAKNRYLEAITLYSEAEKVYLADKVNRFGLDHISLFNFSKEHQKQPFTAAVVDHFAALGEEQVAIQLLNSLLVKGYAKRKTKKVQEQLGKQLATEDVARAATGSIETLAAQHTQNSKDLKNLGKAYQKERRKLMKS